MGNNSWLRTKYPPLPLWIFYIMRGVTDNYAQSQINQARREIMKISKKQIKVHLLLTNTCFIFNIVTIYNHVFLRTRNKLFLSSTDVCNWSLFDSRLTASFNVSSDGTWVPFSSLLRSENTREGIKHVKITSNINFLRVKISITTLCINRVDFAPVLHFSFQLTD